MRADKMKWERGEMTYGLDGTIEKLISLMNQEPRGILGISACSDGEEWRYYIAASLSDDVDDSLEESIIPGCMWALSRRRDRKIHSVLGFKDIAAYRVDSMVE